ncbi:MAG: phage tail sheath subtilisin-like domain-containing protein [Treponema sp.]
MGVQAAKFDSAGQSSEHYIPGNYSVRNTVGSASGVSSGKLAIIGTSTGGKPLTLHCVSDKSEAKALLSSGALLSGVCHAFSGSNSYIPQEVYCMRVNNGTQSKRTLKKGSDTILTLLSADYGVHTNQIKLWLKDGADGKKVILSFKGEETQVDGIGKKSLSILYSGTGTKADCTINADGLTLTSDVPTDSLSVTWDDCQTIEALVARINDCESYSALAIDVTPQAKASELDHVTNVSVKDSAHVFSSDLAALMQALKKIPLIGDVKFEGGARVMPDNDTGFVYFGGAEHGTSTQSDWAKAIDLLSDADIQIIATPSTDDAVHALIADLCAAMSTVDKKRERTCWLGSAPEMSIDDALKKARGLNSEFASLVITGANAANPLTGSAEDITPALLACKCAGMESAIGVSNPLTNKMIKVNSFSKKYKPSELNKMIAGGITPFGENDDGELVCIRSMTTYQGNSLVLNERSMIRSVLYMDRDIRKAFNKRIGTNDEPSASNIIATLKSRARIWYAQNLITKSDEGELVQNVKVRFDGDKTYLTFERFVRAPNNFTFITGTNKVYSSTVAL